MNAPESTRFYNWLGAMIALAIAVVLTWFWRVSPLSMNTVPMQAEEEVAEEEGVRDSPITNREFVLIEAGDEAEVGLEDESVRARLNADVNLNDFYNAQQIFRGENGHYSTDLVAIGWAPSAALMGYKLGFLEASVPMSTDEISTRQSTDEFLTINETSTTAPYVYDPAAQLVDLSRFARLCRQGCTADENGYEVMIAVPLDAQGRADVWLFNDRKELTHVWDGISNQQLQ